MKLKRQPEDFQVEELTTFKPDGGPFSLYKLSKRSIGTPEAIAAIQQRWNLPRHCISYGGLKDRHALSHQFVTIKGGPRQAMRQANIELAYLGQSSRPFGPKDIAGNRFHVVMRDMTKEAAAEAAARTDRVKADGLPNYFDDQRFGSVGESGEFVGKSWCEGDYERALWLALADPNSHDRPEDRAQKELLRTHWKDWPKCKAALEKSHRRSIVTFLCDHPTEFKGALGRIDHDLRSLFLSAYQSHLWNLALTTVLREHGETLFEVKGRTATFLFFESLKKPLDLQIALPSARVKEDALLERVLAAAGTTLRNLRIKYPKDSFFSKGSRAALFRPGNLVHSSADDDLYPRRVKTTLSFDLPRGSYATILVKRVTLQDHPLE